MEALPRLLFHFMLIVGGLGRAIPDAAPLQYLMAGCIWTHLAGLYAGAFMRATDPIGQCMMLVCWAPALLLLYLYFPHPILTLLAMFAWQLSGIVIAHHLRALWRGHA